MDEGNILNLASIFDRSLLQSGPLWKHGIVSLVWNAHL